MKTVIVLFILLLALGCARTPLTPEEQHKRADALIIEREQFWIAYDNCLAHGIVMFEGRHLIPIRQRLGERRPKIDIWTMRSATCVPRGQ